MKQLKIFPKKEIFLEKILVDEKGEQIKTGYKSSCCCEEGFCDNFLKIDYLHLRKNLDLNPKFFEISINGSNDITKRLSKNSHYFSRHLILHTTQIPEIIQSLSKVYQEYCNYFGETSDFQKKEFSEEISNKQFENFEINQAFPCECDDQQCDNILKIIYPVLLKNNVPLLQKSPLFEISIRGSNYIVKKTIKNERYFKRSSRISIEKISEIILLLNQIYNLSQKTD